MAVIFAGNAIEFTSFPGSEVASGSRLTPIGLALKHLNESPLNLRPSNDSAASAI
jgi:hypothetical protein